MKEKAKKWMRPALFTIGGAMAGLAYYYFIGKPIALNFWASWCGPCQMEMPDFHEKYLQLGEKVNFLMINMTTGRETQESAILLLRRMITPSRFFMIRSPVRQ